MLDSKSFLAVDFGAGSLKLAEFEVNEAGGLRLKQYGIRSLGAEGAQEAAREATDRKSTRLNSSHSQISYAVFCLKKKTSTIPPPPHDDSPVHSQRKLPGAQPYTPSPSRRPITSPW